jgi:hypothetical protein
MDEIEEEFFKHTIHTSKFAKKFLRGKGVADFVILIVLLIISQAQFGGYFPLVNSGPSAVYFFLCAWQCAHAFAFWSDVTFGPTAPLAYGIFEFFSVWLWIFVVWRGVAETGQCTVMDAQARADYRLCRQSNAVGVYNALSSRACTAKAKLADQENMWLGYCYHAEGQSGQSAIVLVWILVALKLFVHFPAIYLAFDQFKRHARSSKIEEKMEQQHRLELQQLKGLLPAEKQHHPGMHVSPFFSGTLPIPGHM